MTPDEVRAIVREEIETYAASVAEVLAPVVVDLIDVFGLDEAPIVSPILEGLTNLFLPHDDDSAAA